jgi:hypothetical protein
MSFSDYMQTGLVIGNPGVIERPLLLQYCRLMNRSLLRRTFDGWSELTSEHSILKKSPVSVLTVRGRSIFGAQLWAFHFWLRYARFRRTRDVSFPDRFFVSEWALFRGKVRAAVRMEAEAEQRSVRNVLSRAVRALLGNAAAAESYRVGLAISARFSGRNLLRRAMVCFRLGARLRRFSAAIERRVLRAWYTTLDSAMVTRVKASVMAQRKALKTLRSLFFVWKDNARSEKAKFLWLHDAVTDAKTWLTPWIHLLFEDHVNFAYHKAFVEWRKILYRRKRVRRFASWSFSFAVADHILQFVVDVLRNNANLPVNRWSYQPFTTEDVFMFSQTPAMSRAEIPLTNAGVVARALARLDVIPASAPAWQMSAPREHMRTLLYRLIVARSDKTAPRVRGRARLNRLACIHKYVVEHHLDDRRSMWLLQRRQTREDSVRASSLQQRLARDSGVLSALDCHLAALELAKVVELSVCGDVPLASAPTPAHAGPPPGEGAAVARPRRPAHCHPMLRAIPELKASIAANKRRYRRDPAAIWGSATRDGVPGRRVPSCASCVADAVSTYEAYAPPPRDSALGMQLSTREFRLGALRRLQEAVAPPPQPPLQPPPPPAAAAAAETPAEAAETPKIAAVKSASQLLTICGASADEIEKSISRESSTPDVLENAFLSNDSYFEMPQAQRVQHLVARLSAVLAVILGRAETPRMPPLVTVNHDVEAPARKGVTVTRIIRTGARAPPANANANAPPRTARKRRRTLFEDPDVHFADQKPKIVSFKNAVFTGTQILTDTSWIEAPSRKKKAPEAKSDARQLRPSARESPGESESSGEEMEIPELAELAEEDVLEHQKAPRWQEGGAGKQAPDMHAALEEFLANPAIDPAIKRRALAILDRIARRFLLLDLERIVEFELIKLVESEPEKGAPVREEMRVQFKEKKKFIVEEQKKRHRAFETAPIQRTKSDGGGERRIAFGRDLALAVLEGERFMRTYVMKIWPTATGQSALDLSGPRRPVADRLRPVIQNIVFPETEPEPQPLAIGGRTPRLPPQKVKPTARTTPTRAEQRPTPTLTVGGGGGRDESPLGKRRPQTTKMTAVMPKAEPLLTVSKVDERSQSATGNEWARRKMFGFDGNRPDSAALGTREISKALNELPGIHPKWRVSGAEKISESAKNVENKEI